MAIAVREHAGHNHAAVFLDGAPRVTEAVLCQGGGDLADHVADGGVRVAGFAFAARLEAHQLVLHDVGRVALECCHVAHESLARFAGLPISLHLQHVADFSGTQARLHGHHGRVQRAANLQAGAHRQVLVLCNCRRMGLRFDYCVHW